MSVRAKFKVISITRREGWNGVKEMHDIELTPVTGASEENKRFFAATPGGQIRIGTANGSHTQFELGAEYYVDFTKAE